MSITTDTAEWDAFVTEVKDYCAARPDVCVLSVFDGPNPIYALVGLLRHNDVTVRIIPDQMLRNRFERLRARRPPPEEVAPLAIGDRCMLNSGGPVMTVIDGDEENVIVAYRSGKAVKGGPFKRVTVRRVGE